MAAITHRVEYSAKIVPLELVIESLQAQLRLLNEGVAVMARSAPGSEYRIVSIQVNSIETGSLIIDLLIESYRIYQHTIDGKVVGGVESLLGVDVPKEYEALVTLLMLGVTFYVSRWVYDAVRRKKKDFDQPPTYIQGDYNKVINIIAERLVITPEAVESLMADTIPPHRMKQLVRPVANFFRPAKREANSTITVPGVTVGPESIAEFPSDADLEGIAETEIVNLPDTLIQIRATDRDRSKQGWAAKIIGRPDFADRRLAMDLYPTVDADALAAMDQVRADLAIEMTRGADGALRAKKIHLLAFRELNGDEPV